MIRSFIASRAGIANSSAVVVKQQQQQGINMVLTNYCSYSTSTTTSTSQSPQQRNDYPFPVEEEGKTGAKKIVHRLLRSKLFIPVVRDQPMDKEMSQSQLLMQKTGMIRRASLGMYMTLPLAQRAMENLIKIIDEEMQGVGGQKLTMPLLVSKDLWEKTGRWETTGAELIKVKDRKEEEYCLAPTHEEIFTSLVANERLSNSNFPLRLYQIGNKYRDEIRPRFGLVRGREFLMKDLYSFDQTRVEAVATYNDIKGAYHRVFDRVGLKYACVEADSGNIGGSMSHEFQVLTGSGEDTVVSCECCGYQSNIERATSKPSPSTKFSPADKIKKIAIKVVSDKMVKGAKEKTTTIATIWCSDIDTINPFSIKSYFNNIDSFEPFRFNQAAQQQDPSYTYIDFIDSTIKDNDHVLLQLKQHQKEQQQQQQKEEEKEEDTTSNNASVEYGSFRVVKEGDHCAQPNCSNGGELKLQQGIEVGHIFYLGTKYSSKLGANMKDKNGKNQPIEMGCYGIGVSRLLAAMIESKRDDRGIVWSKCVAPYKAIIIPFSDQRNRGSYESAEHLYDLLIRDPFLRNQIVLENRLDMSIGKRINEANLIGFPYLIFVNNNASKKNGEDVFEVEDRDNGQKSYFTAFELYHFFRYQFEQK
ncbi:prolyl-tRNA synthetase [Cavenderia fasciculata]|uniref:proline--tRNA ligase n=1 Tax=Cavenderia fasciculata TaxID=261658 RepID=F4Q3C0_CACFS|nr:prolyl-tRNA synthetase [Cavenderia fasciculata]EGG17630.1 prolyl-tRNA synthetase [Cavenderia fasciculata]|eukprot:XP_004356114.1 prolyl-tRNA synthetase [Cavenderia fasciculata]